LGGPERGIPVGSSTIEGAEHLERIRPKKICSQGIKERKEIVEKDNFLKTLHLKIIC
jgi:hypothetical protein